MKFRLRKLLLPLTLFGLGAVFMLCGCQQESPSQVNPEPTEEPAVNVSLFTDTLEHVDGNENEHVTMETTDDGYDIFAPLEGKWGYRYGPSIMYYADGSVDAWFATPGTSGEWDWFTYKHSDDGGKTWSPEKVVLQPTPDSMDHYSVCDPGVIYFDGYYYLGYTSTIVSTNGGINNNVFVARSRKPDGPYEKWNGSGWGGDPQPIVYFDESDQSWGAGEISFVAVDGTLYCYYTWTCPDGNYTKVSTSDMSENWPANLEYRGFAYAKQGAQDSCDVVYIEDCGKFVAFSTFDRFTATSGIALFESNDGINFTKSDVIRTGISQYCHNMGISKRPDGHIQLKDDLFVGYAYSDGSQDNWGKWATRFQSVKLSVYEGKVTSSDKKGKGTLRQDYFWEAPEEYWPVAISVLPHKIEANIGSGSVTIDARWYDTTIAPHEITDASKVTFDNYDENIVSFDGLKMNLKNVGKTSVTMHYEGLQITFKVYVRPDDFVIGAENPAIASVRPVNENMTVYLKDGGRRHSLQIRGYVVFEDETWGEAYNDYTRSHPDYPANVPAENYLMSFEVEDSSIIRVSRAGIITPKKTGSTKVTVTFEDGHSFTVNVTVEEARD